MESQHAARTDRHDSVLLSAKTGQDKIDLVQSQDGMVMILLNDEQVDAFCWEPAEIEEGAATYMRILADQPTAG